MRCAYAIFNRAIAILFVLVAVLISYTFVITVANVVLRFFRLPILWSLQTTELSVLFIPFLGAAWVLKNEGHVKLDFLLERVKPSVAARLNLFTSTIAGLAVLALTYFSARATYESYQVGYMTEGYLQFPRYLLLLFIPLTSFLLFVQFIFRTWGFLRSVVKKEAKQTEARPDLQY